MSNSKKDGATPIDDSDLDTVQGGLLPAVKTLQETARASMTATPAIKAGDGSVKPGGDKAYEAWPC